MTQIQPRTPEEFGGALEVIKSRPRSIQLHGVCGGSITIPFTDQEARSLHSEPDIDTIMPLPGGGGPTLPTAHAQLTNVVARSPTSDEKMSDTSSVDGETGGEQHSMSRQSSSGFANIEVMLHPLQLYISLSNHLYTLSPFPSVIVYMM